MNIFKWQITSVLVLCFSLFSCGEEGPSVPDNEVNPLRGAYILYQGSSGGTDYAFYDAATGNVTNNVYSSSNSGRSMNVTPGDMRLNSNRDLYITALGTQGSAGTIYRINSDNNVVSDSLRFGVNPYGFVINNNRLIVSNFGSSYASLLDLDFNIIRDSISVGPDPRYIIYGMNKYVVTKSGVTSENSVSFVDESTNMVTKIFYPSQPVSAVFNVNGFFVSAFSTKKIYRIESKEFNTVDSFVVPTSQLTIGELVFKTQSKFFIIAANKEIWEASISGPSISFRMIFDGASNITVLSAAYEQTKNEIYIGDANDFFSDGELHIIDAETGLLKTTYPLGGKTPVKLAFKY